MCESDCQYDQTEENGRFDHGRHVFKYKKPLNKTCLPLSAETDQKRAVHQELQSSFKTTEVVDSRKFIQETTHL